jgi:hypothetical protein
VSRRTRRIPLDRDYVGELDLDASRGIGRDGHGRGRRVLMERGIQTWGVGERRGWSSSRTGGELVSACLSR